MTTIITRLYQDEQTANGVAEALFEAHFKKKMLDLIGSGDDAQARMEEAQVPASLIESYAQGVGSGQALLVVRAPFGGAEKAGIIVDQTDSLAGDSTYVSTKISRQVENYILKDHPHIMTSPEFPSVGTDSSRNIETSVYRGTKFWARFPFDHLIPGHKFQAGFPIGHLIPGHKFQAGFPIGHLIPGHKYQAKFPFGHIVPGHKFMAKFPFGHIVPGHKYMANWIWPHTKTARN